jgi:hypothetical protein
LAVKAPKNSKVARDLTNQWCRMPEEPFEPDEVRVCMLIAFCLSAASLAMIYRLVG